jgi:hypothetical protein
MGEDKDFVVTPWKVEGIVDYDRLIEQLSNVQDHEGETRPSRKEPLLLA